MIVMDVNELPDKNMLVLNTKVMTGEHEGKLMQIYLKKINEPPIAKEKWVRFLLAFWTKEQLTSKKAKMTDLISKRISVVAEMAREYNGNMYQDFRGWKDLGVENDDIPY